MATTIQTTIALVDASADNIAASQSPGSGAITLNGSAVTGGVAILDSARRILITSGGDDSSITFTVTGTNFAGNPLVETIDGAATDAAQTTQDFKTVLSVTHSGSVAGTVEIGTSEVASSPWFYIDRDVDPTTMEIGVVVSGTANFTVEYTLDDPNAPYTATFPTPWTISALSSKDANTDAPFTIPAMAIRLTQNSFTYPGTLKMIALQAVKTPS